MPSPAATKFLQSLGRAEVLRATRIPSGSPKEVSSKRQVYYHAALAASVAAWDAYLNQIVLDFYNVTANPLDAAYHSLHASARAVAESALKKFNTPNWENSRNLLVLHTGFDPLPHWVWPAQRMAVAHVQERLNQILKVRHSFAHGFQIPSFSWTQSPKGSVRLAVEGLRFNERLFRHLVRKTDKEMSAFVSKNYGVMTRW